MFGPLAITVAIALLASLFLSVSVITVLCILFPKPLPEKESLIMKYAKSCYLPLLEYAMNSKKAILGTAGLFLLVSLFLLTRLGTEFIPAMDEGSFDMDVSMLPGVSLTKSVEVHQRAAEKLKQFDELQHDRTRSSHDLLEYRLFSNYFIRSPPIPTFRPSA